MTGRRIKSILLAVVLTLAGHSAQAGKRDDTLNVAFQFQLQSLDAYFSPGREGLLLGFWVYDALLYRDPTTLAFKPLLASAWRQVDDRTLEFDIRQGVKFHNGDPLSADDVVFTLSFMSDPGNHAFNQSAVAWIEKAEQTGPNTVRVRAKAVTPAAAEFLAQLPIYPAAYYRRVGREGMNAHPVGTGPYTGEVGPNGTFLFTRFDGYFADSVKGKPAIRRMVYKTIPEMNSVIAQLMTGELDWAYYIPNDQAERLQHVPSLKVVNAPTFRVAVLTMDAAAKTDPATPLRDLRVRRAISHAIDRAAIAKQLVGGGSQVVDSACYPKQLGCTDAVPHYAYDVEAAKKLMAEAGYAGGFDIDLYGYRSRPVADAIVGYLRAIGIRANLRWLQYPAVIQKRHDNGTPMIIDDWGSASVNDVVAFLPFFFDGGGNDQAMDQKVIDLVRQGGSITDPQERKAAYAKALARIADQAYWLPLWTMPVNYAFSADLDIPITGDEAPPFWLARWK
jgi:peptide/nickel transport system substrate-binding protein